MNTSALQTTLPRPFRTRGVHVTPTKFAVQYANSEAEAARQLADFLSYLEHCHVTALLPSELGTLCAETADEIRACAVHVRRVRASWQPLSATARFWIEEVGDVFDAATARLDELNRAS